MKAIHALALLLLASGLACSHKTYPPHWWKTYPAESAPDWEILPDSAGPGEVVLSKRNELGILSNFAPTPFEFEGTRYASLEGFWQMMKYPEGPEDPRMDPTVTWPHTRSEVAQMVAFEAKKAGDLASQNMSRLGIDWVTYRGERMPYRAPEPGRHYELIVSAMREKLKQNPEVRRILLSTGELVLKPDHTQNPADPPEWRYFQVWMDIRSELQQAAPSAP
jgi:predicted NAD-dependent protein-ADP-ribosyltransferase YbiA (DUF1768 family)